MSEQKQRLEIDEAQVDSHLSTPKIESATRKSRHKSATLVLVFLALHFLITVLSLPFYYELFRAGAVSIVTVVLTVMGWICLYGGGVQNARKSKSSDSIWMSATIILALALPGWRLDIPLAVLESFACLLALAGWWAVYQAKQAEILLS
ncbi:hypothetical protein ACO0LD_04220 [Undibacterium sp. Ji83W]|uniref:hypothetical protein n=1 Tax=Undibacterium sp. Ji83W TaxID=3413043 RepID=UPI003BF2FB94